MLDVEGCECGLELLDGVVFIVFDCIFLKCIGCLVVLCVVWLLWAIMSSRKGVGVCRGMGAMGAGMGTKGKVCGSCRRELGRKGLGVLGG